MGINSIEVKSARESDIPALAEIERLCISEPWSENSFAEHMRQDGAVTLTAWDGDSLCGFITGRYVLETADIYDFAVLAEHRRKGAGTALLNGFFGALPDSVAEVRLEVRESNSAAISLYEKTGFERVGMRKNFYSEPRENAVLMTKFLKKGE